MLIVVDRSVDMATPFHHTWTYQALVHDVLDYQLNRVVIEENVDGKKRRRDFDLNTSDKLWTAQKGR